MHDCSIKDIARHRLRIHAPSLTYLAVDQATGSTTYVVICDPPTHACETRSDIMIILNAKHQATLQVTICQTQSHFLCNVIRCII